MTRIRAARPADYPVLQDIERAAGELFRDIGMDQIADDEPFSLDELEGYRAAAHAWVAVDDADVPVGYLVADVVDGNLHIEQVTVDPRHARRHIGRDLIDFLTQFDVRALTLTTFADVPWNAPYYRRCGFTVIADEDLEPGLRALRDHEAGRGLARWTRVCMRRDL